MICLYWTLFLYLNNKGKVLRRQQMLHNFFVIFKQAPFFATQILKLINGSFVMKMMDLTLAMQPMINVLYILLNILYVPIFPDGKVTSRGCSTRNNICLDLKVNQAKPLCK